MNICELITNKLSIDNQSINSELVENILKDSIQNVDTYELTYKEAKDKFEKDYLLQKLRVNNWNMTLTAKTLKLDRDSLYRKVKSLGIKID